ncbi:MAG: methyltransferase family protein [Usitatibacter sp.]
MSERGGWWLAGQGPLLAAAFVLPPWLGHLAPGAARVAAIAVFSAGFALGLWARHALGRAFTPFPRPIEAGALTTRGPYRFARHPIYTSIVICAAAWAWLWQWPAGAACTLLLLAFLDLKSRREEQWLVERYSGYAEYRGRVKRFVPFVY